MGGPREGASCQPQFPYLYDREEQSSPAPGLESLFLSSQRASWCSVQAAHGRHWLSGTISSASGHTRVWVLASWPHLAVLRSHSLGGPARPCVGLGITLGGLLRARQRLHLGIVSPTPVPYFCFGGHTQLSSGTTRSALRNRSQWCLGDPMGCWGSINPGWQTPHPLYYGEALLC